MLLFVTLKNIEKETYVLLCVSYLYRISENLSVYQPYSLKMNKYEYSWVKCIPK